MKKSLAVLLSIIMIISVLAVIPFTANAEISSVTIGEPVSAIWGIPTDEIERHTKSHYIIDESYMGALKGKEITGLRWYFLEEEKFGLWENYSPEERNVDIYLTETDLEQVTSLIDVSSSTRVFSGIWSLAGYSYLSGIEASLVDVTFDCPYLYSGKNLLVTVVDRTGMKNTHNPHALAYYRANGGYHRSGEHSMSASDTASTNTDEIKRSYIPVTTFYYEKDNNSRAITVTPYDITNSKENSGGTVYLQTDSGNGGWQTTGYSRSATLNTSVTVKATPHGNYDFVEWRNSSPTGAVFSKDAEVTFNATQSYNLYAIFKKNSILSTGSCGTNLTYKLTDNGVMTVTGTGTMNDYSSSTVPWKEYRDSITTVTIGNGVTYIGTDAFEYCDGITSVTLGDSVASIGKYAFNSCDNLANINLPDSLTTLDSQVFSGTALTTVSIPSGITAIPAATFNGCKSLTTIKIPKSVTSIGSGAFYNCTALSTVNYGGTEDDWSAVSIGTLNDPLYSAAIYYTPIEPTFKVTYNFNGGTKGGKGSFVTEQVAYAPDITAANFIDNMGVTPPAGMKLDAIEINGKRYELGSNYLLNKDTTYKYIWKSTHTHKYTKKTTKATLTKNGSIVEKCSCGKEKSKTVIYYPKTVKLSAASYTYNGKAKKPTVTVKGADGKTIAASNYTVSYAGGRKNVGKYTVTVNFKGNYSGTKKLSFTIKAKDAIGKSTVTGIKNKAYTGKAIKQSIKVVSGSTTLKSGTDYTVAYKNNKNVGKATVTITGKGNYSGTKKVTFKINPKGTSASKVESPKKAQLKVTLKKQATQTTGYEIQYALKSNFSDAKTVTITSNKTTSKTISKLKSGKQYYVRVRTYKTVSGTKYYSGWSKYSKAVKVK